MIVAHVRKIADSIGIDPWDADLTHLRTFAVRNESQPRSRYRVGSPCRFVRSIDFAVHILLPEMLVEKYPILACYLRSTSPRWGRAWRRWN